MKFLVKTKSGEQEQSESNEQQEMPMRLMDSAPLVKRESELCFPSMPSLSLAFACLLVFGPQDEDSSIDVGKKGSLRFHFRFSVDDRICDSKSFEFRSVGLACVLCFLLL